MFDGPLYGKFSKNCKHCVKCINNRILLIKKKKQATIKFLKKDVADLLANGHDSNAFGRMERLIVEINHAWCYDMIEYYCQCILNLLPSLQKLRECPEEAMEAISTIIFAAARFSDLPELDDLRQAFTEKYGSQMEASIHSEFVEKLQKKSFSTDEKLVLMKNIAEEFSVRCDFRAFQQKKSNFTPVTSAKARTSSNNNERRSNVDSNERYGALNYLQKSVCDASGGTNVRNKDNAHIYTELNRSENERTFTYDKSLKEEKQFTPPRPTSVMPHPNTKYKQEYPSKDKYNASIDQNRLKKDERREYEYRHKEYTIGGASSNQEKEGHIRLATYCEESGDEEEEVMDRLLMHLSKKGVSSVSSKMKGRDRAPQRRQRVSKADDCGAVSKGSNMKGPGFDDDDDLVARLYALKGS